MENYNPNIRPQLYHKIFPRNDYFNNTFDVLMLKIGSPNEMLTWSYNVRVLKSHISLTTASTTLGYPESYPYRIVERKIASDIVEYRNNVKTRQKQTLLFPSLVSPHASMLPDIMM